jgi:hypothetical protein
LPLAAMTVGMVLVAVLAASAAGVPHVTMASTPRRTSSDASSGNRSSLSPAHRYSMVMVLPST